MTSSTLALPSSRLPRCLASCTKPFPRLYLQLNTTKVILYNEVSDISDEYNKKRSITHSVSHPSSLHLIIAFDGSFKESTTSPQRHPFKVSSMCFLGTRFRIVKFFATSQIGSSRLIWPDHCFKLGAFLLLKDFIHFL